MNRLTWCAAALILMLPACQDNEPDEVTAGEVARPGYDLPQSIDAPTQPSPDLTGTERNWTNSGADGAIAFGAPGGEGVISLRCDETTLGNPKLVFNWNITASADQNQTVSMRWGSDGETFAVEPVRRGTGGSVSDWRAILEPTGEEANFLLIATSPITFTFGALGDPKLTAPASDRLKRAIQACQEAAMEL